MASTRPTVVFVHGLFGNSETYFRRVAPYLQDAGYPVAYTSMPSVSQRDPDESTAQRDIDYVRNTHLLPLVEHQHKDVVVLAHSYGAAVATSAAVGLSKPDRTACGAAGGVVGIILIVGRILKEGQSLLAALGATFDTLPPWYLQDTPRPGFATVTASGAMEVMYHDVDPSREQEIAAEILPQAYKSIDTPVSAPCWAEKGYEGRLAYIRTLSDRMHPLPDQDAMMQASGVRWHVADIDSAHVPMTSQPQQVAQLAMSFAETFEALEF